MNKIIKLKQKCNVGHIEQTQEQIDAQALIEKRAEINTNTEQAIFDLLSVDTKEKALITQANMQGEATRIIAHKTIGGKYPAGGEQRLKELGEMQAKIKAFIKQGREAKAKL